MFDVGVVARSMACVALMLGVASCGGSDGPNGTPALVNSIVFVSDRSGTEQIYVMKADGSNVRQLTTIDGGKSWPTVSPNGRRIAFAIGTLVDGGVTSLYSMNADGTDLKELTHASGLNYEPSWSPEGDRIAFVSTRDGNYEIYTMRADGSGQTNISRNPGADYGIAWRPTGNTILFSSNRDEPSYLVVRIFSMTPDGDSVTPLTYGVQPEWAPSGQEFLFKNDGIVWVSLTPDGTTVRQLLSTNLQYFTPTWSPNERAWAFSVQSGGSEEIFESSDTSGLSAVQLTRSDQGNSYYPKWTRR